MVINVIVLWKNNGERYVFMYHDGRESEVLQTCGRFATNPELSFTWFDAAALAKRVREDAADHKPSPP